MTHATKFSAIIVGEQSLLIQCAELWLERGHSIVAIVSDEAGILHWARSRAIEVIAPGKAAGARIATLEFDWLWSIANLKMIAPEVLAAAKRGAINFHDGPLPRYAGLNAPSWALMHRERSYAVTWHRMERDADTGAILKQAQFEIGDEDTALTLNTRCYQAAIESFGELIDEIVDDRVQAIEQDLSQRSYFGRHDRPPMASILDFRQPAESIVALVRALDCGNYPNPLACAKVMTERGIVYVRTAKLAEGEPVAPGAVVEIRPDAWIVGTDTRLVELGRLTDGTDEVSAEALAQRTGVAHRRRLELPGTAFLEQIARLQTMNARFETFWLRQLKRFDACQLSLLDRPSESVDGHGMVAVALPSALTPADRLAAVAAFVLRASGKDEGGLCLRQPQTGVSEALASVYSPWVPVALPSILAPTFADWSSQFHAACAQTHERGSFALDVCVRNLGVAAIDPQLVVEVVETFDDWSPVVAATLTIVVPTQGHELRLVYRRSEVTSGEMGLLAERMAHAIAAMAEDPGRPLHAIGLTTPGERHEILDRFNATKTVVEASTLPQLFAAQCQRTPDATAVVFRDRVLTYAQLDAESNRLAHRLIALGAGPERLVGVHVRRGTELLVAALAISKAGAAYVPLDPAYPVDRLAHMIADSKAVLIVSESAIVEHLPNHAAKVVLVDDPGLRTESAATPQTALEPHHLAYVLYTSGSTGKPKGVMVEHRNVVNFFVGMDARIERPQAPVWLAVTSLSFDISVLELFWTLTRGFAVVIASDEDRVLAGDPAPRSDRPIAFSLFYFASDEGEFASEKYRLLLEGAKFADAHGFEAVWTPERHFHAFGGLYPNPAVASAAIASITKHVKIRAGSCVLPLHHPARVAEEWALVDNLSQGRVGISFASGWQPNDFVFRPENFADAKGVMIREIETVRRLWRGESVDFPGPKGSVSVRTLPRPVQPELPFWITAAGNPQTFAAAGKMGAGILTHLLGQSIAELRDKLAAYRDAWREAGHAGSGHVTLMLHTFIGNDAAEVKASVREPLKNYLRSSMDLIRQHAWSFPAFKKVAREEASFADNFQSLSAEDTEALLEHSFERYYETSGLFGTPQMALARVDELKGLGVDEIACLIDFGIDSPTVMSQFPLLAELSQRAKPRPSVATDDHSIAAQIVRHRVTHLQCTPSMARMLLEHEPTRNALAFVQHLFIGGEALPGALVEAFGRVTKATVTNMYGPTETTIWSSTELAKPCAGTVSIGTPIANTNMYVLDGHRHLLPVGIPGELCIGGDGVARGYLDREALTAERFVPDPFVGGEARMYRTGDLARWLPDGRLEFLGRLDHQVKVRGYRIELGEIESVLAAQDGVREAVVIAREDVPGDVRLVAYYLVEAHAHPDEEHLRAKLAETLPAYMVPSHLVELERFPLTPNAKVDRKALPAPKRPQRARSHAAQFMAPRNDLEQRIAAIWQRVLGIESIAANDNFFELGGHSLLAVQVHRELKEALGRALTVTDIFRFPTLEGLAQHLDEGDAVLSEAMAGSADRASARKEALERRRQRQRGRA